MRDCINATDVGIIGAMLVIVAAALGYLPYPDLTMSIAGGWVMWVAIFGRWPAR